MNRRLIFFAGLMTSVIGAVIGLAVAEMAAPNFESQFYRDPHRRYAIAGAVAGALIGMGQESVRQLKQQQEQQEKFQSTSHGRAAQGRQIK